MRVSSQRVRPIDVMHLGKPHVICCWEVDGWLVDPGPQSCEETLLAAIGGERPKGLLLTHIHFDHAGAAGRWCAVGPTSRSTSTSAARRTSPTRRSSSPAPPGSTAARGLARLWGEVVPVPEANLHILEGGEKTSRAPSPSSTRPATPPTTSATCTSPAAIAFVGDMAGVRVPPRAVHAARRRRRPTSTSRRGRLARHDRRLGAGARSPHALRPVDDPPEQLERVRESLQRARPSSPSEHDEDGFVEAYPPASHERAGDAADAIRQAAAAGPAFPRPRASCLRRAW